MTTDAAATQEGKIALTAKQLEGIIRKVVREELMEFATREATGLNLNKESPLYEDMEKILERKQTSNIISLKWLCIGCVKWNKSFVFAQSRRGKMPRLRRK